MKLFMNVNKIMNLYAVVLSGIRMGVAGKKSANPVASLMIRC